VSYKHQGLAAGRWNELSLLEQMGNIGSEVERAIKWKEKGNREYSMSAFERALELSDLTLADPKNRLRLKEVARMREVLVDFFYGTNQFASSDKSFRDYFLHFALAARRKHTNPGA